MILRNIRKDDNLSYVHLCPRYLISRQYFSVISYSVHIFWSISKAQTTVIFLFLTIQSRLEMESIRAIPKTGLKFGPTLLGAVPLS
jgi:hypothetical protein